MTRRSNADHRRGGFARSWEESMTGRSDIGERNHSMKMTRPVGGGADGRKGRVILLGEGSMLAIDIYGGNVSPDQADPPLQWNNDIYRQTMDR